MSDPPEPDLPPDLGPFRRSVPLRGAYDWQALAELLEDNPRQWTLAFRQERYSILIAIRQGRIKALRPDNGFVTLSRRNSRTRPRVADIYLSYDPERDQRRPPEW